MDNKFKIYKANGHFIKNKKKFNLSVECRALKIEHALERIFSEVGSRHRVKREQIFIAKKGGIEEIPIEQAKSNVFSQIDQKDFRIIVG